MAREPHIPLFLWVATAVLVHLLGGGGAEQAAEVISERLDVQRFAASVRNSVRARFKPMEVSLVTDDELEEHAGDDPDVSLDEAEVADQVEPEHHELDSNATPEPPKPVTDTEDPDEKDKAKTPPKKQDKEKEKPKQEEEKKQEQDKNEQRPDLQMMRTQNRIAVQQHVEDENQEDNPEAEFIADQANHVIEQTRAQITATDQNDPMPTPGSSHSGPNDAPGDSHVNDVAHSEDVAGEIDKAPSEKQASSESKTLQPPSAEQKGGGSPNANLRNAQLESSAGSKNGADKGSKDSKGPARNAQEAIAASRAEEANPDVYRSSSGSFAMGPAREAQAAQKGQAERKRHLPPRRGQEGPMDFLGLGANGLTRGGLNLNLSPAQAAAAVGQDRLAMEREADGERRRSKHRGSWRSHGIERWRAAIENYNSSVKPGNQTALNTARVPFASYLNKIHSRLHPIFADSFLASLGDLPPEHPLSRPDMKTNLEIVLSQTDGKIVKMGVTRSSGSTVFDIAALESVQSASPFGKAPSIIASNDGNVYLHWEFHRNPYYACSTYFARPYMIDVEPEPAPPSLPLPPFRPSEDSRERDGYLLLPRPMPGSGRGSRHATR